MKAGIMKDNELLTAAVTPKRAHLLESWRPLSGLPLLDRHGIHRLIKFTFYLATYVCLSLLLALGK